MANLKEIKLKIGSVKNTQKTTKAMKLVSSAKLTRTRQLSDQARSYANKINDVLTDIAARVSVAHEGGNISRAFVGLSVSRVGGAAQIKATKQVAGTLKLSLAQYRELEAFAQFASDLDEATRRELELGQGMAEVLKQGVNKPLVIEKQIVIIYAGTKGYLNDVAVKDVVKFENELHAFFEQKYSNILESIKTKQKLDDDNEAQLKAALEEFKTVFNAK